MQILQTGDYRNTPARPCFNGAFSFYRYVSEGQSNWSDAPSGVEVSLNGYSPDGQHDCRYIVTIERHEIVALLFALGSSLTKSDVEGALRLHRLSHSSEEQTNDSNYVDAVTMLVRTCLSRAT